MSARRGARRRAQALETARTKLRRLQMVDPRFALIPPGQTQLTEEEINDIAGRKNFFNERKPLHRALLRGVAAHHGGLPRSYHMAVCRLFRMKRLAVVIATETVRRARACIRPSRARAPAEIRAARKAAGRGDYETVVGTRGKDR